MKLTRVLLIAGLLLAAAPSTAADRGFYIGAGAGQVNTSVDNVFDSGLDFDEDDTGFKIFGGYRFFPWLSVEGAYIDGGSPSISETAGTETATLEIDANSLVAAAIFSLPIGEKFEIFVKPGMAYWDSTTTVSVTGPGVSDSLDDDDNGTAFFIGAGAGFNFTENFGIRLEYEWWDVAPKWDSDTEEFVQEIDATAVFISASIVFRF